MKHRILHFGAVIAAAFPANELRHPVVNYVLSASPPYAVLHAKEMLSPALTATPGLVAATARLFVTRWVHPSPVHLASVAAYSTLQLLAVFCLGASISLLVGIYVRARRTAVAFGQETDVRTAKHVLQRYELLASHSRDIILFIRCEDGCILEANSVAVADYGYTRGELLSLSIHDLRAPETQKLTLAQMAQADKDGIMFETVHRRKDGSTFPVEVNSRGATVGDTRVLISSIRNNTERKRAQDALRENQQLLGLFIAHAPAALAMFDHRMHYICVSRRWMSMYKLGDRDLCGLSHYEVFPEITEDWKAAHRRALAGEVVRSAGESFQRADGSEQWVRWELRPWYNAAGDVGGIIIFSEDITERKQAERTLQAERELLRTIVNYMPAAVLIAEGNELKLQFVNPAYKALAQGKPTEGKTFEEIWPDIGSDVSNLFRRVLETGEPQQVLDDPFLVRRSPDGALEQAYMSWSVYRIDLPGKGACGLLSTAWETTQQKKIESALRSALAEKTALLKEVHHRVKNNLQIIVSLLNLQARQHASNSVARETLRDTQGRVRAMALLHETLYREGSAAKVNCSVYLEHLCEHLRRSFGPESERVKITHHIVPIELSLDLAIPCGLIVNELVSNAFKHAFPSERPGEIEVALQELDGILALVVGDNGIGMSSGQDPQSATLGMQLVRGLAQQIGGDVEMRSDLGTKVQIRFASHTDRGIDV